MGLSLDNIPTLIKEIDFTQETLFSAHVSPDADAVASSFGMAQGLSSLGLKCAVTLEDGVPEHLQSLVDMELYCSCEEISSYSQMIVFDTARLDRVGEFLSGVCSLAEKSINIDHHISNDAWADVNYIDSRASACALMVYDILSELGVEIKGGLASLLYAGILDDTGCFRFSNTDKRVLACASELVGRGARPDLVGRQLYFENPFSLLQLKSILLARVELQLDDRLASSWISAEDLDKYSFSSDSLGGMVDIVRGVKGTWASIFAREVEGGWKFSLRSKREDLDVNKIAAQFGGGGHRQAAGCSFSGNELKTHMRSVVDSFNKSFSELS